MSCQTGRQLPGNRAAPRGACLCVLAIAALAFGACANVRGPATSATPAPTAAPNNPAARVAPAPRSTPAASSAAPALTRLPCLDGLRAYRFSGRFSFVPGAAEGGGQLGSLLNLLKDVRFDGAFSAPDSTRLHVSFPGGASQDIETVRTAGRTFERVGLGAWEAASGNGPLFSALEQLDPRALCTNTIATVDASSATPAAESLHGVPTWHYRFGAQDLASSRGPFGAGREGGNRPADTTLDVWTTHNGAFPVQIVIKSNGTAAGGDGSTFGITIAITDPNGPDIGVRAPL